MIIIILINYNKWQKFYFSSWQQVKTSQEW